MRVLSRIGVVTFDATSNTVSGAQTVGPLNMYNWLMEYKSPEDEVELFSVVVSTRRYPVDDPTSTRFDQVLPLSDEDMSRISKMDYLIYSFLIPSSNTLWFVEVLNKLNGLDVPFSVLLNSEYDLTSNKYSCIETLLSHPNCKSILTTGQPNLMRDFAIECGAPVSSWDKDIVWMTPLEVGFDKIKVGLESYESRSKNLLYAARVTSAKKPELLMKIYPYLNTGVDIYGSMVKCISNQKLPEYPDWKSVYKGSYSSLSHHPSRDYFISWGVTMIGRGGNYFLANRLELSSIESLQNGCMPLLLTETMYDQLRDIYSFNISWDILRSLKLSPKDKAIKLNSLIDEYLNMTNQQKLDTCARVLRNYYDILDLPKVYTGIWEQARQ